MKTLLLIDAYAMIYRAYYAFIHSPRMNSRGENTSAIYGFVILMEELLKQIHPTHVGVAFDPQGPTFRHEAYEQYKAQREETPEDIRRAVPHIKRLLAAMNIPVLEVPGFEADDVIGTMSLLAEKQGFTVYMATPDKDYGQLVSEQIYMYRPRHTGGFERMGPKEVCAKYGITSTDQVIDLLGLMGDASDNIPGCKGVGEKTAVQLLQQYGSIDNILSHAQELKGALQTKITTQMEQIRFSRFLATIRRDVPIEMDENLLLKKEPSWHELAQVYQDLEFFSLLKRLPAIAQPTTPKKSAETRATGKQTELTLDMFAAAESAETKTEVQLSPEDEIKARLCTYLLNPELTYNPHTAPNWDALKQDSALWNLYSEVELPLVQVLRDMEQAGVRIDGEMLSKAEGQLSQEVSQLEQQIYAAAGRMFNINSPRQVGEILFDTLHMDDKIKKSRNGQYSTSEDVLMSLKDKHPIVKMILEYREIKKLISTYITALPSYINPQTGKIHTTYNQTVTATGRLSSSNPNLQNLPIRSQRGQLIRQAVIPDEGCVFLSADYSQIELRLMAHFAADPHMVDAFVRGLDIHAATAAKIFSVPIEQVTREQRQRAKTANFGIIYGISAFGLSQQLECSRQEAKTLIDGYFAAFPEVIHYIEQQKIFARQHGYCETLFGRKRYLPDILSHNATVRSFAERNAVNAPIQGTAADIIKMAMVSIHRRLHEEGLHAQMIMQVHDELNFNVPINEVEKVRQIVVYEMENVVHLNVPIIAESGVGKNWLEAH